MAYRVTEDEVIALMQTALTAPEVTPFLDLAHSLINSRYLDIGYEEGHLGKLEKVYAAHFLSIRDPQISKEKTGQGDWTYHGKSGLGLDHTPWGQQIKLLDYLGVWKDIEDGRRPWSIEALV